jgi:putative oxygen-independent coproporphyrinogen III oxidase
MFIHDNSFKRDKMNTAKTTPLALYIHWPFCVSKCPYCDFNSHVRASIDDETWCEALLTDMAFEAVLTANRTLGSIFFGGGTPSLMPPTTVARLIEAAQTHWAFAENIEITLEANPSSVEAARFVNLAKAGVNRVSLGIQSLDNAALNFLGRAHDVDEAIAALDIAQSVFSRVNFDLIYALPGQSLDAWQSELARALSFGADHLSLYQLTIESGTRFETLVRQGNLMPADNDHAADLYTLTTQMTREAGIPPYEISNHARLGQESRHNLVYWRYQDYVGIGPGAHGRRNGCATERHKKPENFLSAMARNRNGLNIETTLDPATQAIEALLMGLRLAEGVNIGALAARFGFSPDDLIDRSSVERLMHLGLLDENAKTAILKVTPKGFPLLDGILTEIVVIEPEPVT